MRIFALETNIEKLKKNFLSLEEREIRTVSFHWFRFFLNLLRNILLTIALVAGAIAIGFSGLSPWWIIAAAWILWLFFIFPSLLRAYIDWRYDFLLLTGDKVIVVDQSSLFHKKITPINLENFASVSAETQFWNLFPFGILHFNLKEGTGEGVNLRYIPAAQEVASVISDTITQFQRRKDLRRYGGEEK